MRCSVSQRLEFLLPLKLQILDRFYYDLVYYHFILQYPFPPQSHYFWRFFVFRNRNVIVDSDTEELDAHEKVELQFSQSSQLEALSSTPNQSSIQRASSGSGGLSEYWYCKISFARTSKRIWKVNNTKTFTSSSKLIEGTWRWYRWTWQNKKYPPLRNRYSAKKAKKFRKRSIQWTKWTLARYQQSSYWQFCNSVKTFFFALCTETLS